MDFLDNLKSKLSNIKIVYIIIFIIVVIIIVVIINHLASSEIKLSGQNDARKKLTIPYEKTKNNINNYTISMWIYVNDWNYRYGQEKIILERVDRLGNPMPSVKLDALDNNVIVSVSCYPNTSVSSVNTATGASTTGASTTGTPTTLVVKDCVIRNVPIQRWANIIISLYGRTLDVYLDGKLVRTCFLPGVPKFEQTSDINITPDGGFSGYTSNMLYINRSSNPKQAYDIYKEGSHMSSIFNNFFNKYKIKFSLLENSNVKGSIEL